MNELTDMDSPARILPETDFVTETADEEVIEASPLQEIWRVVWLNRLAVAGIVAACLILALIATLLATPQFTSTARVQVNRVEANVADVEGVQP